MEFQRLSKDRALNYARTQLRKVARALGEKSTAGLVRINPGGPAVAGEATLHLPWVYVQVSRDYSSGILIRSCTSTRDYYGGPNRYVPVHFLGTPEILASTIHRMIRGE